MCVVGESLDWSDSCFGISVSNGTCMCMCMGSVHFMNYVFIIIWMIINMDSDIFVLTSDGWGFCASEASGRDSSVAVHRMYGPE